MRVRAYEFNHDYEITEGWRAAHGQFRLPPDMFLTRDTKTAPTGIVVFDEATGEDCSAAWLYKDVCGVLCWMAWTVTNPEISAFRAAEAITILEDALESVAQEEGFLRMIGMFKQDSLVRFFEKHLGFKRSDTDKGHFMMLKDISMKEASCQQQ